VGWSIGLAVLVILVLVILMLMNKRVVVHWLSNGVKHTEGPIPSDRMALQDWKLIGSGYNLHHRQTAEQHTCAWGV